ncbi:MAG TPA: hypothetical protein VGN22_17810 [Pseudonocardia sp.]|jgi:hypothetical protein
MIIDCDSCAVRGDACGDCVIGVLLGAPGRQAAGSESENLPSGAPKLQLDAPERRALDVLADQGLVPRLRLVAVPTRRTLPGPDEGQAARDAV